MSAQYKRETRQLKCRFNSITLVQNIDLFSSSVPLMMNWLPQIHPVYSDTILSPPILLLPLFLFIPLSSLSN